MPFKPGTMLQLLKEASVSCCEEELDAKSWSSDEPGTAATATVAQWHPSECKNIVNLSSMLLQVYKINGQ